MDTTAARIIEDFRWLDPPAAGASPLWGWGVAVLAAVLAVVGWWVARKRRGGLPFARPPLPHEVALKALRGLGPLMRADGGLEFTVEVSRILRVYIQERFGLRAPHRSTEEFLSEARGSALLGDDHQRLLARFLAQCDLVKFARRRVVVEEMQSLLLTARTFVEGTKPSAQPEDASP